MEQEIEIKRIVSELTERVKAYPKMWTVDVIKILIHLLKK